MRKLSFFVLISFIFIGFMSAATITVTSPHSGNTWYKGKPYTITWTSTGIPASTNMKINIFKDSITQENFKLQLLSTNTGTKSWTIPTSFETGTYYIRIKTADNAVYDDSDVLKIKKYFKRVKSTILPITPKPKFELKPKVDLNFSVHYEQFENNSIEMIPQKITIYYGDQTLIINNHESKIIQLPEDSSLVTGSGKIPLRIEYTLKNITNKNFRFHVAVRYGRHEYGSKLITFLGSQTHVVVHNVELPGDNTYLPIWIEGTGILINGGSNDVNPVYFTGNLWIRIYPL